MYIGDCSNDSGALWGICNQTCHISNDVYICIHTGILLCNLAQRRLRDACMLCPDLCEAMQTRGHTRSLKIVPDSTC